MSERPILFSGPMVRAILEGRKSQTRRVVNCPPDTRAIRWAVNEATVPDGEYTGWVIECGAPLLLPRECPYGRPGDLLWVRETWCKGALPGSMHYKADWTAHDYGPTWRPSIHMPRAASRLTLRVTDVRVQRVQEISEEDAEAEGATPTAEETDQIFGAYVRAFARLWDSINGKRAPWDSNPWVWAASFKVTR